MNEVEGYIKTALQQQASNLIVLLHTYHGQEARTNVLLFEVFIGKRTPVDAANASSVPLQAHRKKRHRTGSSSSIQPADGDRAAL